MARFLLDDGGAQVGDLVPECAQLVHAARLRTAGRSTRARLARQQAWSDYYQYVHR